MVSYACLAAQTVPTVAPTNASAPDAASPSILAPTPMRLTRKLRAAIAAITPTAVSRCTLMEIMAYSLVRI